MHYQTIRIILYSSLAIVLLTAVWGLREMRSQGRLADQVLHESLEQEMIVLSGAVKSSLQALKYRLLDVLKAEGNDHPTRTFQDSPFQAVTLLEWDQLQWKSLWYSVKSKDLPAEVLPTWLNDWPLSKLAPDEVFLSKIKEVQGEALFAILVPVRRPNQVPMVGVGIFRAGEFGLSFSADENREMRVFNQEGFALALARPAYLGAPVRLEPLAHAMLDSEEASLRQEWRGERGEHRLGVASKIADSNLFAAIESRAPTANTWAAWLYLFLCAVGAVALNWVLFNAIFKPLLLQLSQTDEISEGLRKRLNEKLNAPAPPLETPALKNLEFQEVAPTSSEEPVAQLDPSPSTLQKVVQAAINSMQAKIHEMRIFVTLEDLSAFAVPCDPIQFQTAIEEVLKNAIEAMAGREICNLAISARRAEGLVKLAIEDSGCGIEESELVKVFDPFFSTKDSQGVARGLGLNVVRRVVEEFSGVVTLQRRAAKEGGIRVNLEWPDALVSESSPQPLVIVKATPRPANPEWPQVAIRRPKVRTLD